MKSRFAPVAVAEGTIGYQPLRNHERSSGAHLLLMLCNINPLEVPAGSVVRLLRQSGHSPTGRGLPLSTHNTGSQLHTWATCQWAASIRDYMTCETVTGVGGWMDQLPALDGPYIQDGFIRVNDKPGLGVDLNPDVVKAHLAEGEKWWG